MKILNEEIDFSFTEVEDLQKLEKYTKETAEEINKINIDEMKNSEIIEKVCTSIEKCFEKIFGKEITEKIFKGKKDFLLCIKAFKDVIKAKIEQEKELDQEIKALQSEMAEISVEYSPNRATRRAKK